MSGPVYPRGLTAMIEGGPAHGPGNAQGYPTGRDLLSKNASAMSVNALEDRFRALSMPSVRQLYEQVAADYGYEFGPKSMLRPHVNTEYTVIHTNTAAHPDKPVSLNVNVPSQPLRFEFQDPCFIRRVTATIVALRIKEDGQSEPAFFDGASAAGNYIYAQFTRAGAGDTFQTQPVPLSEICGDAHNGYFFDLIPLVRANGALLVTVTIQPPGSSSPPPFVERVGLVDISFHTERWAPFGV